MDIYLAQIAANHLGIEQAIALLLVVRHLFPHGTQAPFPGGRVGVPRVLGAVQAQVLGGAAPVHGDAEAVGQDGVGPEAPPLQHAAPAEDGRLGDLVDGRAVPRLPVVQAERQAARLVEAAQVVAKVELVQARHLREVGGRLVLDAVPQHAVALADRALGQARVDVGLEQPQQRHRQEDAAAAVRHVPVEADGVAVLREAPDVRWHRGVEPVEHLRHRVQRREEGVVVDDDAPLRVGVRVREEVAHRDKVLLVDADGRVGRPRADELDARPLVLHRQPLHLPRREVCVRDDGEQPRLGAAQPVSELGDGLDEPLRGRRHAEEELGIVTLRKRRRHLDGNRVAGLVDWCGAVAAVVQFHDATAVGLNQRLGMAGDDVPRGCGAAQAAHAPLLVDDLLGEVVAAAPQIVEIGSARLRDAQLLGQRSL